MKADDMLARIEKQTAALREQVVRFQHSKKAKDVVNASSMCQVLAMHVATLAAHIESCKEAMMDKS